MMEENRPGAKLTLGHLPLPWGCWKVLISLECFRFRIAHQGLC